MQGRTRVLQKHLAKLAVDHSGGKDTIQSIRMRMPGGGIHRPACPVLIGKRWDHFLLPCKEIFF